ncbi:nucleotidyltransferase [Candidatus Poribacteria bacterium]|nr:MAG: nucleotidyltransferase [Candidatus Poribacteria bacterium]
MGTGIEPLHSEDYDIDVGLNFHLSRNDYSPVQVKQWVYEALQSGNRTVEYKRPCVRVQYHRAGGVLYHVDLAIYSGHAYNRDNRTYLAKGFIGSGPADKIWEVAEPKRLMETFQQKFQYQDGHREHFRRVIRFLKRWKDVNFSTNGNERPTGIAMTACALNWFRVGTRYNLPDGKHYYDDLTALKNLAGSILNQFDFGNRISIHLPVAPYNNLFEKMSDKQMQNFKIKLAGLISVHLRNAEEAPNAFLACSALRHAFGNDFPLP